MKIPREPLDYIRKRMDKIRDSIKGLERKEQQLIDLAIRYNTGYKGNYKQEVEEIIKELK